MQFSYVKLAFLGSSIGGGEIIIILVVALLLFGAERLPAIARALGKALNEMKRTANELKNELLNESQTTHKEHQNSTTTLQKSVPEKTISSDNSGDLDRGYYSG